MTISTERLKEIIERRSPSLRWGEAEAIAAELLVVREAQSKPADLYLCRVTRDGEELYSPCGKDYPRGRGYYTSPPAPTLPGELLDAMAEVIRISDRDHEAWNRAKAAISACLPDGENCWTCGKYFTYAQHSECDGYCPHCNAPVELDDEDQPSQVVPVEPTEDMVAKAWREALGKCDNETIKRMYATMLAAAPTPTKAGE